MAKFEAVLPTELMKKISKLEKRTSKILDEAIEDGAKKACETLVRPSLKRAIGSNPQKDKNGLPRKERSTGELAKALGVSPVKVSSGGFRNVKIGFAEPRKHKTNNRRNGTYNEQTNAMIANVLEYGRHDGSQPARPWLRPVKKKVEVLFAETVEEEFSKKADI